MTATHPLVLMAGSGQGWRQIGELLLAFVLASGIGLERELRGKSAGMRTQAIVGTASALILLVSKYGFIDVLGPHVTVDPSRVAAQIVSGIGFLGAGLIITRHGAIRGLTTAAAVWETAAIGMAAGAGLAELALVVTALHFVIVSGFPAMISHLPGRVGGSVRLHVTYRDKRGVLRVLLDTCGRNGWSLSGMTAEPASERYPSGHVAVHLLLTGSGVQRAPAVLAAVDDVTALERIDEEAG